MNWTKQAGALGVAGVMAFGAAAATPAVAQPAPYVPGATTSVSTTNPPVGGKIGMAGRNFAPRENVVLRIRSKPKTLKVVKTNRKGSFSTTLKLPKKYKCGHTLIVRGKKSNKLTRTWIVIGPRSRC